MKVNEIRKSIAFVLPGRGLKPVGGFKVVYEYANRLSENGYNVYVVHMAWLYKTYSFFKGVARYLFGLFIYPFCKKWFVLNESVKNIWIFTPLQFLFPKVDYVIATSWETAEYVNEFKSKYGVKFYLLQADESEFTYVQDLGYQQRVIDTWKMNFVKIVICTMLEKQLKDFGTTSFKIYNGLNFNDFFMENNYVKRDSNTVIMLYHCSPHKGTEDGLRALYLLKEKLTDLKVTLFGTPARPKQLESWIEYYQQPEINLLRKLYNKSTVFISPSHAEGWGLPASEAMQCGCAVVTTNIEGFKDFVIDGDTALCAKVGDAKDICDKVYFLLTNKKNRIRIAESGYNYIQQFTWDRAVSSFMQMLNNY